MIFFFSLFNLYYTHHFLRLESKTIKKNAVDTKNKNPNIVSVCVTCFVAVRHGPLEKKIFKRRRRNKCWVERDFRSWLFTKCRFSPSLESIVGRQHAIIELIQSTLHSSWGLALHLPFTNAQTARSCVTIHFEFATTDGVCSFVCNNDNNNVKLSLSLLYSPLRVLLLFNWIG